MRRVRVKKDNKQEMRIAGLTRPDLRRPGHVLQRLECVERQIEEALTLEPHVLIERAKLSDYNSPEYFQEECLVYLIRENLREGQHGLVNSLTTVLLQRCSKRINDKVQALLKPVYVDDCFSDAVGAIFTPILDLKSDRGDFAQVRFWVFLEYKLSHVLGRYMRQQSQDLRTDSLDAESDENNRTPLTDVLRVEEDSIFDHAAIKKGLDFLPWQHRVAFLMRHYGDWEINNKDPNLLTISKYFGVSDRTIRRWLAAAEEQLRLRRGDKQ
jgi:hypothetical protein